MAENGKIHALIPEIMRAIGAIGKDQKNAAQNYSFRGIDDVYDQVGPVLAQFRVFAVPCVKDAQTQVRVVEKNDRAGNVFKQYIHETRLLVSYTLYAAEDGSHIEIGPVIGLGLDHSDKSANKAMSAAMKYALFQTFCIPTQKQDGDLESPTIGTPQEQPAAPVPQESARQVQWRAFCETAQGLWDGAPGHEPSQLTQDQCVALFEQARASSGRKDPAEVTTWAQEHAVIGPVDVGADVPAPRLTTKETKEQAA